MKQISKQLLDTGLRLAEREMRTPMVWTMLPGQPGKVNMEMKPAPEPPKPWRKHMVDAGVAVAAAFGIMPRYSCSNELPDPVRASVAMCYESLQGRLAKALRSAPSMIDGESIDDAIRSAHRQLDASGYPEQDRFGLLSSDAWERFRSEPEFSSGAAPWGQYSRFWRDSLWLRNRFFEGQGAIYCKGALEGGMHACEPSPRHIASANVSVSLMEPAGVVLLRWPVTKKEKP